MERASIGQWKVIGLALETRQSYTIKYGVTKIVPQRYWQGNKSPAILWGSAARRRISVPLSNHSAACNPYRHVRHRKSTINRVDWVTPDRVQCTAYIIMPQIDDVQGDTHIHRKLKNWQHWQRSPVVNKVCISSRAPHYITVLQNGQDKTPKASSKKQSIKEYSTCDEFLKIPSR